MKLLIVGASGGTGRTVVDRALKEGHEVSGFCRRPPRVPHHPRLRWIVGDAMDGRSLASAVAGHEAVIVTLGIAENPLWVRLFGPARTASDVRSVGTRNVVEAMQEHGLRRLIVLTSYGVGDTRPRLRWQERLFFSIVLAPQIRDTERQTDVVQASDLDWVLVQPVHLTDALDDSPPLISLQGDTGAMTVSRRSVARFMTQALGDDRFLRRTASLSGALRRPQLDAMATDLAATIAKH